MLRSCTRRTYSSGANGAKDIVRIAVKLPSEERVVRKFAADAHIEELYAFVECYDLLDSDDGDEKVAEPSGFEHAYAFRLVSPMPREVYDVKNGGTIRERIGRSGNLIVERVEGEDGDEDDDEDEEEDEEED
jgi:FAS-associated factor 2